jgi:hypothetical protein
MRLQKRRQIELGHHVQHEERQMILRQPIPHRRRHQEQLIEIPTTHVHGHA